MAGYQVKVMIEGTKPPMWRRIIIPDKITFEALHRILQIAFGWWDEHLHDFEFQHMGMHVGNLECVDAEFDEREYLIDDALRDGWIRYTYDFGDNWEHKIVLEKELPDYKLRYPQVIKFRRDNFEEDCGGVWDAIEQEPYDMEVVNEELQRVCKYRASRKCKSLAPEDEQTVIDGLRKAIEQCSSGRQRSSADQAAFEMFGKMLELMETAQGFEENNAWREKEKKSAFDQTMERISAYYDELNDRAAELALDMMQGKHRELSKSENGGIIAEVQVGRSKHTMEHLMAMTGGVHLRDDLKYLGISIKKSWKTGTMAKRAAERLQQHSEYLMLLLEEEELDWLLDAAGEKLRKDKKALLPELNVVIIAAAWGIAEASLAENSEGKYIHLAFSEDGLELLEQLRRRDRKKEYQQIEDVWEQIVNLLACYGFSSLSMLYDKYVKAFGMMEQDEFFRYIYLKGKYRGEIATGVDIYDGQWAAASEDMATVVTKIKLEYELKGPKLTLLPPADFSKEQIMSMSRGFERLYPQWNAVYDILTELGVMRADERISELFADVMKGLSLDMLMNGLDSELSDITPIEREHLKAALRRCWCEMGIPVLNGHSRREIAKLNHIRVEDVVPVLKEENTAAILPDDPCPCNSGKRYRQCCGRQK